MLESSLSREYFGHLIGISELFLNQIIDLKSGGGISLIDIDFVILEAGNELDGFSDVAKALWFGYDGVSADVIVKLYVCTSKF